MPAITYNGHNVPYEFAEMPDKGFALRFDRSELNDDLKAEFNSDFLGKLIAIDGIDWNTTTPVIDPNAGSNDILILAIGALFAYMNSINWFDVSMSIP